MKDENRKRKLSLGDIIRKMNEPSSASKDDSKPTLEKFKKITSDKKKIPSSDLPNVNKLQEQPSLVKKEIEKAPGNKEQLGTMRDSDIPGKTEPFASPPPIEPSPAAPLSLQPDSSFPKQPNLPLDHPVDADEEEVFDIFRYLGVIIRRKEIIILTTIVMGLFSLFSYLKSTKYYRTSARLLYRPDQESIIDDRSSWRFNPDRDRNFNTHLELLKSSTVIERVSDNLGDLIKPGKIMGGLKIRPGDFGGEETNIIELTFRHTDPEITRDVLNELCRTYVDYRREVNAQEDTRLILKLKIQINKIQDDLNDKENALRKFKEKHRMVQLSHDANLLTTKLANMELALQQTQLSLFETKERLTTLKSQIGQQQVNIIQSMTYENPIRSRLADLELELNTLSGEYSPDHFKIKQIKQQIENLKQAMQSEIEKEVTEKAVKHILIKNPIRESLLQTFVNQNIEISALEVKRTAQEQIIEKLTLKMEKLPSLEQEFAFLQREKEALIKTLKMLKIKHEETKIQRDSKESALKILELAKLPLFALSSKKVSSIFIGLFIGLIIGIALVFLLEYLDQSLKDPAEVEKSLELPLIGIVPLIETDNAIVDNENLTKSMLEPFRALRANIKHIASQHQATLFMICSAVKGEGKTTLAINLAITFALDGKKVLLIDGDLRRSQIHSLLNIKKELGLSDYLINNIKLDEIIKPTIHDNLFVITSGERPHNPAELLGIPKFGLMLQELKPHYDIVFCDSPALIPVSDSMSMAPHMDCCIMVVRALWTPLKAAKQAKNQLVRIGSTLVGGILNGISHSRGYYPYYYGYYGYYPYSYKYSYDYDKEPRKKLTIREFGLSIERGIKSFFQNIRVSIPRFIVLFGSLFKHLLRKSLFWILLILVIAVTSLRYFLVPPTDTKKSTTLITYLNDEEPADQGQKQPITIIPSSSEKKDSFLSSSVQEETNETTIIPESQETNALKQFAYEESLSLWKESFNSPDTSRLLQFYDKTDFKYPGGGFTQWREEVTSKMLKKHGQESIITIDRITTDEIKPDYIELKFQSTISKGTDTLSVQKRMIWKYRNNTWRIIREKSKNLN